MRRLRLPPPAGPPPRKPKGPTFGLDFRRPRELFYALPGGLSPLRHASHSPPKSNIQKISVEVQQMNAGRKLPPQPPAQPHRHVPHPTRPHPPGHSQPQAAALRPARQAPPAPPAYRPQPRPAAVQPKAPAPFVRVAPPPPPPAPRVLQTKPQPPAARPAGHPFDAKGRMPPP